MSGNNYRMLTIVILYEAQIILGSSNCLQTPNLSADISVYPRDFKRSVCGTAFYFVFELDWLVPYGWVSMVWRAGACPVPGMVASF